MCFQPAANPPIQSRGFWGTGSLRYAGGFTPAPVLPNLRIRAQGWKGSIGAGQAAHGGIATGGLYCFPRLDGITAQDILLAELPQRVDDRQSCTLPSNPTETSPSGKSFPLSHKQWVWWLADSIRPHLLISTHVLSQRVPITFPSLGLDLHRQWTKAPANNKIPRQWNLCFSIFYQAYFLEAFKISFSYIWSLLL